MPHAVGEFCLRYRRPYYFVSRFLTDYRIEINSKLIAGRAGDFVIFEPNELIYHGPAENAEEGFVNDWLYIDGEDFGELTEKYPLPKNTPFRITGSFDLGAVIDTIRREEQSCRPGYEDKCRLIMENAIIDIFRLFSGDFEPSPDRLEFARTEIMRRYRERWTLESMAKVAGYSQSRFSALYRKRYGTSPMDDLIAHRIESAKLRMLYGGVNLSEIADEVGFSSIYYFSRSFKKRVGVSPVAYRRP